MSLNKTALKKMKKGALVEHILKIQKENETNALFSSDEDNETSLRSAASVFSMRYPELIKLVENQERNAHLCVELQGENEKLKEENHQLQLQKDVLNNLNISEQNANMILRQENKCLKEKNEKLKEREELEWSFIDESMSVGEYRGYLKEFHPEYLKKTGWESDSDEE